MLIGQVEFKTPERGSGGQSGGLRDDLLLMFVRQRISLTLC